LSALVRDPDIRVWQDSSRVAGSRQLHRDPGGASKGTLAAAARNTGGPPPSSGKKPARSRKCWPTRSGAGSRSTRLGGSIQLRLSSDSMVGQRGRLKLSGFHPDPGGFRKRKEMLGRHELGWDRFWNEEKSWSVLPSLFLVSGLDLFPSKGTSFPR